MDLSFPVENPKSEKSKNASPASISDHLKRMLYMTNIMEKKQKSVNSYRSVSPQLKKLPPAPIPHYQYPSLALGNLRKLRAKSRSSEKKQNAARGRSPPQNAKSVENVQKSEKQSSTDRIMAFSERFGKIHKQGSKSKSPRMKENSGDYRQIPQKVIGAIVKQKQNVEKFPEPVKFPYYLTDYSKQNHPEILLSKMGKNHLKEPLDNYIYEIFNKTQTEFENLANEISAKPIYSNIMKELNNTMIKQRQSAKNFGETTIFNPSFLLSLCKKLEDQRWLQLYLARILYKKPMIAKIRNLFNLAEKYKNAKNEYKELFCELIREKQKFSIRKNSIKTDLKNKPFLCGKVKTSLKNKKNMEKIAIKSPIKKCEDLIEDLNLKVNMVNDKVEKLSMKLSFEILKFERDISLERKTYLELIVQNANKSIYHFFMGAWIHYKKIKREKRELISLAQSRISLLKTRNILYGWKNVKINRLRRLEIMEMAKSLREMKYCKNTLKILENYRKMKKRKRFLIKTANSCENIRLMSKSIYFWNYETQYNKTLKEKVKLKLQKSPIKLAENYSTNRIQMQNEILQKIHQNTHNLLAKSKSEISENYPKITLFNKLKPLRNQEKAIIFKNTSNLQSSTVKIHEKLLKFQTKNLQILENEEKLKSPIKLIFPTNFINSEKNIKKHAKMAIDSLRKNIILSQENSQNLLKIIFIHWKISILIKAIQTDIKKLSYLRISKELLQKLRENHIFLQDRENELYSEYYLKKSYILFKNWRKWFIQHKLQNVEKVYKFRIKKIIQKWKNSIIYLKKLRQNSAKITEEIAKIYKKSYISYLRKSIILKNKSCKYQKSNILHKFIKKWNSKAKIRILLRKVFKNGLIKQIQKRKNERKYRLDKAYHKLKFIAIDSSEAKLDKQNLLKSTEFYNKNLIKPILRKWLKLSKYSKNIRNIIKYALRNNIKPIFINWIKITEKYLESILKIRLKQAQNLKNLAFSVLKRKYLIGKMANLCFIRKILIKWKKAVKLNQFGPPLEKYAEKIKQKVMIGFRIYLRRKLEKQKEEIIKNELIQRKNIKLTKKSLAVLMEYSINHKKKKIMLQTINEFHYICLMRKTVVSLMRNIEQKRQKRIKMQKAISHYEKIKEKREEIKKMLYDFSKSEYGLTRVFFNIFMNKKEYERRKFTYAKSL